MSDGRVDINRPEYSWIPFFEELARRLYEDGWRDRQPEIVAELQRMKAEGMVIADQVENLTDWIDPFSLVGTIRRVGFENAVPIMESFQSTFGIESALPLEDPITPTLQPRNSFFFDGIGQGGQTEVHWNLFEHVMTVSEPGPGSESKLADLLNRSLGVRKVGHAKLSGALFWIKPHEYLKTDTVADCLDTWDYSDFGHDYLWSLLEVRSVDPRPFPVINADTWLTGQFLKDTKSASLWQIRGGKDFTMVDEFIDGGFVAVDFGLNDIVMSSMLPRTQYFEECKNANSELTEYEIGETWRFANEIQRGDVIAMPMDVGPTRVRYGFALSDLPYHETNSDEFRNRRGITWHRPSVNTSDLPMPGAATVTEVAKARDDFLSRIESAERGTDGGGDHSGGDDTGRAVPEVGDGSQYDEPRVWFVHSRSGEHTDAVVEGGYIGLGWDNSDFKNCRNREDVKQALRAVQSQPNERRIAQETGSVVRFLFEMSSGDLVMTRTLDSRVHCGTIRGEPTYDNDDGLPFATRRPVDWQSSGPFDPDFVPSGVWSRQHTVNELHGDEAAAALRFYEQLMGDENRVWVVRAWGGEHAHTFVQNGYVSIGWGDMDMKSCNSRDDVDAEHQRTYPKRKAAAKGNEVSFICRFLFEMKIGDFVLTPTDDGTFYNGVVTGDCTFNHYDGLPYETRRSVEWSSRDVREKQDLPSGAWQPPTVYKLNAELRDAFMRLVGELPPVENLPPYSIDTMLGEGVFMKRAEIKRILAQLERKRNLILQGPPGTGKTFLAKRLAYALMGERADGRVVGVQFHQSYSYEDFVGGYRPGVNDDEQLVFKARDGAFLRLCERAREAPPGDRFVMLIDEINRGNLSRVFGELLMLIEPDKRSPEHAVELQHLMTRADGGDGKFFVPDNVYIIGTMNLADRSLTGMNVAMRRRFAFAELRPQFESERFADEIGKTGMPDELLSRIVERMRELNVVIAEDASLGRQYQVGHSFFCPDDSMTADADWDAWYKAVVEFEIRPLLEEYWFDDPDEADRQTKALTEGMPSERDGDEADSQGAETNEEGDGRLDG